jgi:tRNA(fMet)-specific endonuclease VapC
MRRYLLDTGSAGDFINRRQGVDERVEAEIRRGNVIGIGMPVLAELLFGAELSRRPEETRQAIARRLARVRLWPFDVAAARMYGRLSATLRRMGRPMQQIDVQIAAIALSLGNCAVVTKDNDLAAIPGLSVENWSQPSKS